MSNPLWEDNSIQFPRLLAEIFACADVSDEWLQPVCESMDLDVHEVLELFSRAQDVWDAYKATIPTRLGT